GRGREVVAVNRTGLQLLLTGGLIRDDLEGQLVKLYLTPVVLVAHQFDGVVSLVVLAELERSGAGRVLKRVLREGEAVALRLDVVGVVLLHRRRRLHRERWQAEDARHL